MNVLKYNIEVTLNRKKIPDADIHDVMNECLLKDQSFEGSDYKSAIKIEWQNLKQDSLKLINSPEYLIGAFEKNGIRIFVFEIRKDGLKNKSNVALEVLCFADLPVEKILNDSFNKIESVFVNISTKYIEESQILIYPFDSQRKDIWSPDMKIKADIISPFEFEKRQIGRWIFIGVLTVILGVLYLSTKSIEPFLNPVTNKIEGGSDMKNIYLSLMLSGVFYIILELAIHLLIPFIVHRDKRNIQVRDLQSIVDQNDPFSAAVEKKPKLSNPKIEE